MRGLEYNQELEDEMFLEEVRETMNAMAENKLVDVIYGISAIMYVLDGTKAKALYSGVCIDFDYKDNLLENLKTHMAGICYTKRLFRSTAEVLSKSYTIICDTNMSKLVDGKAIKDAEGNIVEPEGFISSKQKIKELLEQQGCL